MSGWTTVFADLEPEPVRGRPADYRLVASDARRLCRANDDIADRFARVAAPGALTELDGAAVDRLAAVIAELAAAIGEVPPLFDRVDRLLSEHADRLDVLHHRARAALDRAHADRLAADDAARSHDDALVRLRSTEHRIRSLHWAGDDPTTSDLLDRLEHERRWQQADAHRARDRADRAEAVLAGHRDEYRALAEAERDLVDDTVATLRRAVLDDLTDPHRLTRLAERVAGGVAGTVTGAADTVIGGATAVGRGVVALAESALTRSLRALADGVNDRLSAAVSVAAGLRRALVRRFGPRPASGDRGGTYGTRTSPDPARARWSVGDSPDPGREVLRTALAHTADEHQIGRDEFELVRIADDHGGDRYLVVLPGVTDLSRPQLGLDPHTRTVRDLDQGAVPSSSGSGLDRNPYAAMVATGLRAYGVPPGAEVMLVGHSYGADTALDLAADPRFNGPGGYRVTHAVAAGYDSTAQMSRVPAGTEVLVLQNNRDVVVLGEHVGQPLVAATGHLARGLGRTIGGDLAGGLGELAAAGAPLAHAHTPGAPLPVELLPVDVLLPTVDTPRPGQSRVVFAGGGDGWGHHPDNYTRYVAASTEPAVAAFAASVAAAGYAGPGSVTAVDVSVPERRR